MCIPHNIHKYINIQKATAERIRKARARAATRLQVFAVRSAERHKLNKRFAARKAKLDFERRNRAELASACLVMSKPSRAIRDAAGKEDFEALGDAVRPAAAVARLRARAAARGISISELIAGGDLGSDDGEGEALRVVRVGVMVMMMVVTMVMHVRMYVCMRNDKAPCVRPFDTLSPFPPPLENTP